MSIASEITRLQGVKSDILTAIGNKGVTVPEDSMLDDCPGLIADIPTGGEGLPTGYMELDYIQFDRNAGGANFVIPVTDFGNEDKEIACVVEFDGIYESSQRNILRVGNGNDSTPGIRLDYAFWSASLLTTYSNNNRGSYYTPTWDLAPPSNKAKFYMKNDIFNIEWSEGTVSQGGTNYASSTGFNKIFLFTDSTNVGEYNQFWGKFYRLSITDVVDLRPAKRLSDSVLGLYDMVTDSFITANYGASNIIAGPVKL